MMLVRNFILFIAMAFIANPGSSHMDEPKSYSRFDYEYKVLQKLVDLETANREQNHKIEELTKKNLDLENEIYNNSKESKKTIASLQTECKEANKELKVALDAERNTVRNTIQSLTTLVENLTSSSNNNDQRSFYGLSAYESASSAAPKGSTIVLSRTHLNEGSSYNTGTGQFTTPVDGIYIFHATLCIHTNSKYIFVEFMAGEEVLGRFASVDKYWDTCHSGSALVRLKKGSQVFLRVTATSSGEVLKEDNLHTSSFSGFLLGV